MFSLTYNEISMNPVSVTLPSIKTLKVKLFPAELGVKELQKEIDLFLKASASDKPLLIKEFITLNRI